MEPKEESKYYVPQPDELYIGYELEHYMPGNKEIYGPLDWMVLDGLQEGQWTKGKIVSGRYQDMITGKLIDNRVRVPYLTHEDILSEGWVTNRHFIAGKNHCYESRNIEGWDYSMIYKMDIRELTLYKRPTRTTVIEAPDPKGVHIYQGECKSINELRVIMKLTKINL